MNEGAAELMFGQDQGTLVYLKGSDSEALKRGNDAFELLIQKTATGGQRRLRALSEEVPAM